MCPSWEEKLVNDTPLRVGACLVLMIWNAPQPSASAERATADKFPEAQRRHLILKVYQLRTCEMLHMHTRQSVISFEGHNSSRAAVILGGACMVGSSPMS